MLAQTPYACIFHYGTRTHNDSELANSIFFFEIIYAFIIRRRRRPCRRAVIAPSFFFFPLRRPPLHHVIRVGTTHYSTKHRGATAPGRENAKLDISPRLFRTSPRCTSPFRERRVAAAAVQCARRMVKYNIIIRTTARSFRPKTCAQCIQGEFFITPKRSQRKRFPSGGSTVICNKYLRTCSAFETEKELSRDSFQFLKIVYHILYVKVV